MPMPASRSRVLVSSTADPLVFISISTNFSSRGYNEKGEEEEEEEDKGVSAARFGSAVSFPLASKYLHARPWIRIMPREGERGPTLSSDLSSINIPWTVFQKRHAQGLPKYLGRLCTGYRIHRYIRA